MTSRPFGFATTWPPPKATAYGPRLTEAMISTDSRGPPSMQMFVMRGIGSAAYDSRRALPVVRMPIRRALGVSFM